MPDGRVRVVLLRDRRIGALEVVSQENVTARRRGENRADAEMGESERAGTRKMFQPLGQGAGEERMQIVDAERRSRAIQPRGRNIFLAGVGAEPVHPGKTGAQVEKFPELCGTERRMRHAAEGGQRRVGPCPPCDAQARCMSFIQNAFWLGAKKSAGSCGGLSWKPYGISAKAC